MARLKMAPNAYPEGLVESRLPTLQAPKMPSRLELLKNDYQERNLRVKEEKMMTLLKQQQERISHRATNSSLYTAYPSQHKSFHEVHQNPYSSPWAPEESAWASNWTVSKRTAGIDRAHPLKPVYHRKATTHVPGSHHPPSANRYKPPPVQEQVRSKSGPARTNPWQQLEKKESNLEAEIRRKEALLREKLRKTEEELRRMQREREEAEMEDGRVQEIQDPRRVQEIQDPRRVQEIRDPRRVQEIQDPRRVQEIQDTRRVQEIQDTRRVRAATTQHRATKTYHYSGYSEQKHGEDRPHHVEDRSYHVEDRSYQDIEAKSQVQEPTLDRSTKHIGQTKNVTPPLTNGSSHITMAPQGAQTNRSAIGDDVEVNEEDLVPCDLCGRRFMVHRLEKHMQVCQKMLNSKRKVFDSSKARAKGTDLEQYLHTKGRTKDPPPQVKGSSWRQKHESFIRNIRQARVVQDVVSKGGKPSDVPPPPPDENPDYVTCPHCSRRFAPRPAERHIPMCATIKNRPCPPPGRRR
ncbi:zinc finger C2HC domain-containing protein 1C isoform X2 [Rana temporaria]|nr:zinc finger C2HC domain-containing protein 1C isoform X2 [Rana temporaria]XP_040188752.1 zinc finger C2HC domain-containing protein 1C isoform X2 [Rana temporaria]